MEVCLYGFFSFWDKKWVIFFDKSISVIQRYIYFFFFNSKSYPYYNLFMISIKSKQLDFLLKII